MDPTEQLEIETRIGEVLKSVYDPEIPVNIVDLGLVYDVRVTDSLVEVDFTLTSLFGFSRTPSVGVQQLPCSIRRNPSCTLMRSIKPKICIAAAGSPIDAWMSPVRGARRRTSGRRPPSREIDSASSRMVVLRPVQTLKARASVRKSRIAAKKCATTSAT